MRVNGTRSYRAACLLAFGGAVLISSSCGDDGVAGPSVDFSGWWQVLARDAGTADPYVLVRIVNAAQSGSVVHINGIQYTFSGATLTGADPSPSDRDRTEFSLVVSQASAVGTMTRYSGGGVSSVEDVQMYRTLAPSGALSGAGIVQAETVTVNTSTGYASAFTLSGDIAYVQLIYPAPYETLQLGIQPTTPPLSAQAYAVGSTISAYVETAISEAGASSGTVTVTSIDSGHITGSYDLDLDGGTTISGSFDLDILIIRVF